MTNITLLTAQGQGAGFPIGIIYFLVLGLAFYFMLIRPQKKQREKAMETVESVKVGDDVVMRSGAKGRVVSLDEDYITIETGNNNSQVTFLKYALNYIVKPAPGYDDLTEVEEKTEEEVLDPKTEELIDEIEENRL